MKINRSYPSIALLFLILAITFSCDKNHSNNGLSENPKKVNNPEKPIIAKIMPNGKVEWATPVPKLKK